MGDRYELELHCAYCNTLNSDVWYAPTCSSYSFTCKDCKKENFIKGFRATKIEEITIDDLYDAFMDATNTCWTDEDLIRIKKECEIQLKEMRGEQENE